MNRLAEETSPYLIQHKDNPVDWYPWGAEALSLAKSENKPILLSVGYAACHWCHVMAHESFENPAIADLMNSLYINIKVDREERPDIDTIYMNALHALGQQGGWPLTMFLTPDGEPFWGGTYFPPTPKFGQSAFPDILKEISRLYTQEPEKIHANQQALTTHLRKRVTTEGTPAHDLTYQVAERLETIIDTERGGVRGTPKFPQTGILETLWHGAIATTSQSQLKAVTHTLTHISQGGIYDHLGGGYARYSVDADWLVPHFEKMLYDNALLIDRLTQAWTETGTLLYKTRIEETIGWIAREMTVPEGAFAASLDADSEGEEGKFYVWSKAEVTRLLGADADLFATHYDVTPQGNFEGHSILNRTAGIGTPLSAETEETLAVCRHKLLAARKARVRPGWDDKALLDWNGLTIAAIARAALALSRPDWQALAETAYRFVTDHMRKNARTYHTFRAGKLQHRAMSDGLANMIDASLALFEATQDWSHVDQAQSYATELDAHYWDEEMGGYYFTADDAEALLTRTRKASDDATPAANGSLPALFVKLYALTGDPHYRDRADRLITCFAGAVMENPFPYGRWLASFDTAQNLTQIVLIGDPASPDLQTLKKVCLSLSLPTRLMILHNPKDQPTLPADHPAGSKNMIEGKATAYICTGPVCSAPVTDPDLLLAGLKAARLAPS
ncbi:MAG: thioredoxin domain-containing protein [Parvibaculum sp.]